MRFTLFPYTNFHALNLDWLIATVKELQENNNPAEVEEMLQQFDDTLNIINENLIKLIDDPQPLSEELNRASRKIADNVILTATSAQWTDLPTDETEGCLINVKFLDQLNEYPLVPEGTTVAHEYNALQIFSGGYGSGQTPSFYFRLIIKRYLYTTTTPWTSLTAGNI